MQRKFTSILFLFLVQLVIRESVVAQGIHFSQYYNAPMLLNPANTALMPESDYRVGLNYRNQWSSLPVPYRTFSAYADFQVLRSHNETNWLGLGLAFFNDKAGNGDLSLTRTEAFVAYHILLGSVSMVSGGISGAYAQRSVDINKLTFDSQWDDFSFNTSFSNNETAIAKTTYMDVSAGLNFAYFPNENVYIKLGVGASHLNQPKESFYGMTNQMGIRPSGNLDLLFRAGNGLIVNPSIYYTNQKSASELMYGSLFIANLGSTDHKNVRLVLGAFHRLDDAIVGAFGFEYGTMRVMASYDYTISQLGTYNNHNGALEFGLRWEGMYNPATGIGRKTYNCPRF